MRTIPTYDLYGEKTGDSAGFWLHCETIPSRSSLHHWEIGLHRHKQFFQILYIEAGSGDAVFGDAVHAIAAPAVITVPPLSRHGFRFSKDIDGFVFTVLTSHLKTLPADHSRFGAWLGVPRLTALLPEHADSRYIADTLHRLAAEAAARRTGPADLCEAYLTSALRLTARVSAAGQGDEDGEATENQRRLNRLSGLIHQHFRSHKPASFYAHALNVSPTHLNRIVKQLTGASTQALINGKLIDEAQRELLFTQVPVQEIGFRLGFSDPAYFSRFFLTRTGLSPRQWRRAQGREG
ncbi:helix-turn-helix domain-containing protein [Pararhizobium sp. YC-54]|uniref:helix-turn-helix domain-containing protein n=1 Tax=Pararhizobium sp. YC-54 TaxID=2986920 RepID=UPI0021F750A2|nr:helix-turn-helix domain-containing protein [Pararhizobium sp. YC-54]MCW0002101.1 helix-turn-helix domain-containing protein [Pararhizobium sp. YC-54]